MLRCCKSQVNNPDFIFFCRYVQQVRDAQRHFHLTSRQLNLINPNTITLPIFRTHFDAELTTKIYERVPVLVNEQDGFNPWSIEFLRMFDMTNDSNYFIGAHSEGSAPLYEAKMIHIFDHRFANYEGATQANLNAAILPQTSSEQKSDSYFSLKPKYWVPVTEIDKRLQDWKHNWLFGYRRITSSGTE